MCKVIFSGSGHSSHMAPESTKEIPNLLISVNQSGVSDGTTLLDAYKELDMVLMEKNITRPVIVIADGHGSRFDEEVLTFLLSKSMHMFIIPPDTSGQTQMHDQMNGKLHTLYQESKDKLYSDLSNLNRESFMHILSDLWKEWIKPDLIRIAAKKVGITCDGLNIDWMNQDMFRRAEALLDTGLKENRPEDKSVKLSSPVGVRKHSRVWYEHKLQESLKIIDNLTKTPVPLEEVDGLLPMKKIEPKKSTNKRITNVHGAIRNTDLLAMVHEKNEKEKLIIQKREEKKNHRKDMQIAFDKCIYECTCTGDECNVKGWKKCTICSDVLKSQCGKKACLQDGKKTTMIKPATKTAPSSSSQQNIRRNLFTEEISSDESDYIDEDWEAYMQEMTVFSDDESGPSWDDESGPSWA